jgi:hypothetical protein
VISAGGANGFAEGVVTLFGGVSGGFTNTGTISALATGAGSLGTGVVFSGTTVTGGVTNTGMIRASGGFIATGLLVDDRPPSIMLFPTASSPAGSRIAGRSTRFPRPGAPSAS